MSIQRTDRLNSLLKEVISEVIRLDIRNPKVSDLLTITRVEITKDLHMAKVYVSVIGSDQDKTETVEALKKASGFIGKNCSKKVVLRFFPSLTFVLDDSVDKHLKVEELLGKINQEKKARETDTQDD